MWAKDGDWHSRRDEIKGKALEITETELVDVTVKMWQKHAAVAAEVRDSAMDYIRTNGFDTSASAVQALKWAQEEERKTRGAEALISTIRNAANEDLIQEVRRLAARQLMIDGDEEVIEAQNDDEKDSEKDSEKDDEGSA